MPESVGAPARRDPDRLGFSILGLPGNLPAAAVRDACHGRPAAFVSIMDCPPRQMRHFLYPFLLEAEGSGWADEQLVVGGTWMAAHIDC